MWQRHTLDFLGSCGRQRRGSIVDRLMYNAFRGCLRADASCLTTTMTAAAKLSVDYRKLVDAICSGDPTGAKKAAPIHLKLYIVDGHC